VEIRVGAFVLFDSRLGEKVAFEPRVAGEASIYVCGLTVQDAPHIGHACSAVAFDVLRRHLERRGLRVRFVRNLTDIDDKIIRRAAERLESPDALVARSIAALHAEMAALGVRPPDVEPRVTRHIDEIVALVGRLVEEGHAYAAGGDVYFSVATFASYGALSGQDVGALVAGARIDPTEHKRSPADFALWKAAKAGEPSWDSPWGRGRPGWHIECSAMSLAHLGETFDIHGGGRDLVFPHHENERAQSEAALGEGSFARHWMHNGLLTIGDAKMSKSLGNFHLVSTLRELHGAETIRHYLVSHHYRANAPFEVVRDGGRARFPALEESERRLAFAYETFERHAGGNAADSDPRVEAFRAEVDAALDDDLNTPRALAAVTEALRTANRRPGPGAAALVAAVRDVAGTALGLFGDDPSRWLAARRARHAFARGTDVAAIDAMVEARDRARASGDFAAADAWRGRLAGLGVDVSDGVEGARWRPAAVP
jgi:cysteinyl-tRNA synthetase